MAASWKRSKITTGKYANVLRSHDVLHEKNYILLFGIAIGIAFHVLSCRCLKITFVLGAPIFFKLVLLLNSPGCYRQNFPRASSSHLQSKLVV